MNSTWPGRRRPRSSANGSFTLTIISAPVKDLVRSADDGRARRLVLTVRESCTQACPALDQNLMAVMNQFRHGGGDEADPVLVVLELFGDADAHEPSHS